MSYYYNGINGMNHPSPGGGGGGGELFILPPPPPPNDDDEDYYSGNYYSVLIDTVGVQDMTTLGNLTVEGIRDNLRERYSADLIYTYTGTILISVNPYKELNIYGTPQINLYHNSSFSTTTTTTTTDSTAPAPPPPPHIYAIAEQAYNNLIRNYNEDTDTTENQSIVISGESGAGKTETTKFILQYLCHVTSNVNSWVENQILEANTILESFGNAKTVRNDNSSRFGKFMRLSFDGKWVIRGCIIQDYLLEQSRITSQCPGERNYHVFYQLITAARGDEGISKAYFLGQWSGDDDTKSSSATVFNYLEGQKETTMGLDPLMLALQILQIPQDNVNGLFSVVASILHLGNLRFGVSSEDGETAILAPTSDELLITHICQLLKIDKEEFKRVLLSRQINVRGNITEIPLRGSEAGENRHAMAKALYSKCFGWLISHINERTNPGREDGKVIGLLDIFGFENFEAGGNSFEQICINYANEKLHKFFNSAVFAIEQEIYKNEGLNISHIQFTDNAAVLELIEKPPRCILKLLTEQCHLPKGSDLGFLNNLHTEFETHGCYEKGERRNWDKSFTILHYAGKVTYTVQGFVDKNRDVQQDLFFNILASSANEFVANLANSVFESGGGSTTTTATIPRNTSKGRPTVAETFRGQLGALVEVLGSTKASYVRCIKPNEEKNQDFFDEGLVTEQLRYLGMLEIIRIRKEGYSVHMPFPEFVRRYKLIGKFRIYGNRGVKEVCSQILDHITPSLPPPPPSYNPHTSKSTTYLKQSAPNYFYQLGSTKAFLKPQAHELLESKRQVILTAHVTVIQKHCRAYRCRTSYRQLRNATIIIQRAYRSWKTRLQFIRQRRAAIKIQSHLRGFFAREVALALREMRRVEEELRKRELERKRASSVCGGATDSVRESSDEGEGNYSDADNQVVGGTKDVSLDNLFEFLLVDNNKEPSSSHPLDKISDQMDRIVSDLNGIHEDNNDHNARINGTSGHHHHHHHHHETMTTPTTATTTATNSICSSMSNFEIDADAEFDADESDETRDEIHTPTNDDDEDNLSISPPPLVPPPENIPVVAAKVVVSRLPEPKEKPPPPPVGFMDDSSSSSNSGMMKKRNNKCSGGGEPIYESIQPRNVVENKQQVVQQQQQQRIMMMQQQQQPQPPPQQEYKPITQPIIQNPPPPPPPQQLPPQKPRVEKRMQEINQQQQHHPQQAGEVTGAAAASREDEPFTFHQYALQYFSLENRKSNQSQKEYVMEHTQFTKNYHINHPHVHLYDPSNIQVACWLFRDVNKLMRGEVKNEVETLQTIIGYGIEREELRDEIFVQLLRQICGNGNVEWLERLYLVFCLGVVSFPASKGLCRVIRYELEGICVGNCKLNSQIRWILDNLGDLKKMRGCCVRRLPPSSVEIQAMKRLGTIVCRFFFLDGRTKAIDIHPTDTAGDAVIKLGGKIGVGNPSGLVEGGWGIYQVRPGERVEEHVSVHAFIYDVIAGWESGSGGCGDNRFVFKKRLFKGNCREIPQDPVECALLYAQAVFCVVKRDDYPVAEKVSLQLAGLQAQVLLGDPPPHPQQQQQQPNKTFENYTNIESFLPIRIARTRSYANWVPILAQAHRTFGLGKTELVARVWYLSCVMQYPLYGTTMFHVVYRGYWVYGNSLVLGISSDGISMVKSDDKFIMYEYAYNQIESVQVELSEKLVTINLNRSLPPDTHKCFVFESNSVVEIGGLIGAYCPGLGVGMNHINNNNSSSSSSSNANNKGVKQVSSSSNQMTNQDRMRLYGNLLSARKNLIDTGLLRKPEKSMVIGVKLLKNTLRRLSKQKIERMRQYEAAMGGGSGEGGGGDGGGGGGDDQQHQLQSFPLEWFCYSKHGIPSSLTVLGSVELESAAVWVFGQLQAFAGLNNNSSGGGSSSSNSPMKQSTANSSVDFDNHGASILQGVFEKVWRSDGLINELYVQLIKQTTDHPEPNSRVNSRNWGVLSLVCSVIAPVDSYVRKYLNSHLKRCALTDFVTEEGKYARFAEKCLQHTISSSSVSQQSQRRQWPPSRNEIICTVNRKPITARFHFMDGKYHTLQFAPNDTAADLVASLTSKIGLPEGVKGYAIYEVSTTPIHQPTTSSNSPKTSSSSSSNNNANLQPWERSLTPQEKPVEVIARWERQKSQHQQATTTTTTTTNNTNHHNVAASALFKFVIRKHLYDSLDLGNAIEKELVYHQLLSSARNDRFPVNDTEAAMLVALQAQVELGDYASSGSEFPDYCHVSAHCLPTRIAALCSHEAVARHHQSLVGTGVGEAKQAVLNLLMSWPLFKCIVFDVTQSFTSNWPRSLWLALDNTGLHLLPQRTRHTLCTFEYRSIKSYSPSPTCFMVITRESGGGDQGGNGGGGMMMGNNKVVLSTNQAYQIAQLIKEFVFSNFMQQQQQQQQQQSQQQQR